MLDSKNNQWPCISKSEIRDVLHSIEPFRKSLLIPLALHERFVDCNLLEEMDRKIQGDCRKDEIERVLQGLADSQLLHCRGQGVYEKHPELTEFLRSDEIMDFTHEAGTYHQLGIIAQKQHNYEKAKEWYLKSLAISEKQEYEYGLAITYHQIGLLYQEQQQWKKSVMFFLNSLKVCVKGNIEHEIILENLSDIWKEIKNPKIVSETAKVLEQTEAQILILFGSSRRGPSSRAEDR